MQTIFPTARSTRLERTPFDFAALFILLVLLTLVASGLTWRFWYASRIYNGVSVAGVSVSGLTRAVALRTIQQQATAYPLPPIALELPGQSWPLNVAQARVQPDLLAAVNQAYLVGRQGSLGQRLVQQLLSTVRGQNIAPALTVDAGQLRYALAEIANRLHQPAQAASQVGSVTIPAQPGLDVDVESTLRAILLALQSNAAGQAIHLPLRTLVLAPPVSAGNPATGSQPTAAAPLAPLQLRDARFGLSFAIDPEALRKLLFSTQPLKLDEAALRQLLVDWAAQVDIPAHDARLRFDSYSGALSVLETSQPGRKLDVEATLAAISTALNSGQSSSQLVINEVAPAVDMNKSGEMGIREVVASASSYYAGSSAERIHNIEVAAAKFDGVVIPPAGIFSYNHYVEAVSSANGFEDSLIIWGDQTVKGVGGGVCQVSTTIFRAAFNGGLPIVERYNHGYVVGWYGDPGQDATIFTPSVDFRFRNDTAAYLLIEPVVDSQAGVITFNFYGTKPNRAVSIGKSVITDVQEPGPAEYRVDESLTTGQKKQVEYAAKGMKVSIERTIVENGVERKDVIQSEYQPWNAVFLVGPGTEIPATPTPVAEIATP